MKKQRIAELDFFRTIAFLAVALQHVLGAYQRTDISRWESAGISVLFLATKFAVPAFVFASGLVLFYNYYESLRYGKFLVKRIKEILIPYILWTVLYYIYYTPRTDRGIEGYFKALVLGEGGYHLWYIVMIFQFYLFLPFYIAVFRKIEKHFTLKGRAAVFCIFTVLYSVYILLPSYFLPYGIVKPQNPVIKFLFADYITRNSISYVFYFILGGVVALNLEKMRDLLKKYSFVLISAFAVSFILLELLYYKNGFTDGKIGLAYPSFFKPHYFLLTILCILTLYRLALAKWVHRRGLSHVFKFIGDHSFQAYLAHAYAINIIAGVIYKSGITFKPVIYGSIFLGCIILSLCVAFLLRYAKIQAKALFLAVIKRPDNQNTK